MSSLSEFSDELAAVAERASHSIVAIQAGAYRTLSGIILDPRHIAVPEHGLKRRDGLLFTRWDGSEGSATLLGRDPGVDLAILQSDGLQTSLPAADLQTLKAGQLATVVGMTRDVGASVSLGVFGAVGPKRRTWRMGTLDQFVRVDASLYPSQNGAAVLTAEGHLVGMATPALSKRSTIAIPLLTIHRVLAELQKEGRIRSGYLGVGVQAVSIPQSLQAKLSTRCERGLILLNVVPGSPAEQAGLQVGDILLSLNQQPLIDNEHLQILLRGDTVGHASELLLLRGGEPKSVSVEIQESERS